MSVQVSMYHYLPLLCWFQYILCVGSSFGIFFATLFYLVSIHPMCRFKKSASDLAKTLKRFQYILCVGSSSLLNNYIRVFLCFNTSYVSVQVIHLKNL